MYKMCKNHLLYVLSNCRDTSRKSCSGCNLLFCTGKGYCYLYDKCDNDMSFFCELCLFWICCCNCCEGCGGICDTNSYSKIKGPISQKMESVSEHITSISENSISENSIYGSVMDNTVSLFFESVSIK